MAAALHETVFSLMIEIYDRILLERYVAENPFRGGGGGDQNPGGRGGRAFVPDVLDNGSTFHFEYEVVPVDGDDG